MQFTARYLGYAQHVSEWMHNGNFYLSVNEFLVHNSTY